MGFTIGLAVIFTLLAWDPPAPVLSPGRRRQLPGAATANSVPLWAHQVAEKEGRAAAYPAPPH